MEKQTKHTEREKRVYTHEEFLVAALYETEKQTHTAHHTLHVVEEHTALFMSAFKCPPLVLEEICSAAPSSVL